VIQSDLRKGTKRPERGNLNTTLLPILIFGIKSMLKIPRNKKKGRS